MKRTARLLLCMQLFFACVTVGGVGGGVAHAFEPFIIGDIRFEGLERLSPGTVSNYILLQVGDELTDEDARISSKELFATGFFKNIEMEKDGDTLVIKVVERPSIATLTITGNNIIDTETLQSGIEQAGLVEGKILNSASLDRIEQEIQNTYLSLGRYSTVVTTGVEDLERNRVAVTINIDEGRVAVIKKVNIIGANEVSKDTIVDLMSLRDKRGYSLFTKRNQYSKPMLEADIEAIRSYYLDRGFHEFEISSTVDISPNKQNIFISIILEEGDRYVFAESEYESNTGASTRGLDTLISIVPGEPFSRRVVNASRAAISRKFANDGYANVEVRPLYETDHENKTVKTVFTIETKQRTYVRKVIITGNSFTRDQVIRRELRQFEGAWYSLKAVELSRTRLSRSQYFQNVSIETPPVAGVEDQVDMIVTVTERETGSVSLSLGYSDSTGGEFSTNYTQRNLLGGGNELNFNFAINDTTESATIRHRNPYYNEHGVSRTINVSSISVDTTEADSATFQVNSVGGGVDYGIPIAEDNTLSLGINAEDLDLSSTASTPVDIESELEAAPGGVNLITSVGVSRNTRNHFYFPTKGSSAGISLSATAPGSEYEYFRVNLNGSHYIPIFESMSLRTSFDFGYGGGYGDTESLPFFRRYYAGGSNSVRGFRSRTLGPRSADYANRTLLHETPLSDLTNDREKCATFSVSEWDCIPKDPDTEKTLNDYRVDDRDAANIKLILADDVAVTMADSTLTMTPVQFPSCVEHPDLNDKCYSASSLSTPVTVGGDTRLLLNSEFYFPAFGSGGKDKRFGLFIDGGMVYGDGYELDGLTPVEPNFDFAQMRWSAGLGFYWQSPIGPFVISYAETLNEEPGDSTENFQINLGIPFR